MYKSVGSAVNFVLGVFIIFSVSASYGVDAEDEIRFDFEGSAQKWMIPDWAYYQGDHKAREVGISSDIASSGKGSLEIMCDFPGDVWAAALVEVQGDMDLSGYDGISVDIYLPGDAPKGLFAARLILTVGEGWFFTEMREAVPLKTGEWTKVWVSLDKGGEGRTAWKGRKEKRLYRNLDKVRKIAVRIEYDASPPHRMGPRYEGPVYIDNVVIK
ncbi:MAG: hypothetical protein GF408_08020 [Candidatus Omnitrophica bacterium]|nr:hypothetical protein [Candidatus Omnitrophota bacterium]